MKNVLTRKMTGVLRPQGGFTLVEMMVAITIGLFMLLAISSTVFTASKSFVAEGSLRDLQDGERLAFSSIGNAVQIAGYYPTASVTNAASAFPNLVSGTYSFSPSTFGAGQVVTGSGNGTASGSNVDSIAVRFLQDPTSSVSQIATMDCTGSMLTTGSAAVVVNMFQVSNGQLTCTSSLSSTVQVLVSNVQSMTILYGVDVNSTGSVSKYLPGNSVTSWGAVRTAMITLVFNNPLATTPGQPATFTVTRVISVLGTI